MNRVSLRRLCLAIATGILALAPSHVLAQIKAVRIAHHSFEDLNDIDAAFLEYAARSGYTHVLAHGSFFRSSSVSEWLSGEYKPNALPNTGLLKRFTELYKRAAARNIGVIPCFNMTSRWAGHWSVTHSGMRFTTNPQNVHEVTNLSAPDPNGIQKAFRNYLGVIRQARINAGLGADQDYLHIGHDENYNSNANANIFLPGSQQYLANGALNPDWQWLSGMTPPYQNAYHALMAREMIERVDDVKSTWPSKVPGIIFWADLWDSQFYAFNGGSMPIWTPAGTNWMAPWRVMRRPELASYKQYLIPMLWMHTQTRPAPNPFYDPEKAIDTLADNGFNRIMVASAYEPWPGGADAVQSRNMVHAWVKAAQAGKNRSKVIGYSSQSWAEPGSNPVFYKNNPDDPRFRIWMDYAQRARFYRRQTDLVQLWDNGGRLYAETYKSDGTNFSRHNGGYDMGASSALAYFPGDVDHDDKTDIIQLRNNGGRLAIETFRSAGTPPGAHRYQSMGSNGNAGGAGAISFLSGDIDGDFATDIFQLWNNNGQLYVETYRFDPGTWLFQRFSGDYTLGAHTYSGYQPGDFNGDGRTDLMGYRTGSGGSVALIPFLSSSTRFSRMTEFAGSTPMAGLVGQFVGDVDGNGLDDVLFVANHGGQLKFDAYRYSGVSFAFLSRSAAITGFGTQGKFLTGDFDGNGQTDMVRLLNESGNLRAELFLSNGTTLVFKIAQSGLGAYDTNILAADMNRDGKSDLIKLQNVGGRLQVQTCQSDGAKFKAPVTNSSLGGFGNIQFLAADVDGNRSF